MGSGRPESPARRPHVVEACLRAVERGDRGELAKALRDAGDPTHFESPWKEDVEFAQVVGSGDLDAIWSFGTRSPPAAARARALHWLAEHGRDAAEKARAAERLRAEYPASWAANRSPAGARPPPMAEDR